METAEDFASSVEKDSTFWFFDGNVVLLTWPDHVFRVHKGVLALHSEFFNNMFDDSLPTPPSPQLDDDDEEWSMEMEGCPVLRLDDSTHDIRELLDVMYGRNRRLSTSRDHVTFAMLAALVRLGDKYGVDDVVEECKAHLVQMVPTTFDGYANARSYCTATAFLPDSALEALHVYRLLDFGPTNTPRVTAFLLFLCAQLNETQLRKGVMRGLLDFSMDTLDAEDIERILALKAELQRRAAQSMAELKEPSDECKKKKKDLSACYRVYEKLAEAVPEYVRDAFLRGDLFQRDLLNELAELPCGSWLQARSVPVRSWPPACADCVKWKVGTLDYLMRETFHSLPKLAGVAE